MHDKNHIHQIQQLFLVQATTAIKIIETKRNLDTELIPLPLQVQLSEVIPDWRSQTACQPM